jgi:hypothetical protein
MKSLVEHFFHQEKSQDQCALLQIKTQDQNWQLSALIGCIICCSRSKETQLELQLQYTFFEVRVKVMVRVMPI